MANQTAKAIRTTFKITIKMIVCITLPLKRSITSIIFLNFQLPMTADCTTENYYVHKF